MVKSRLLRRRSKNWPDDLTAWLCTLLALTIAACFGWVLSDLVRQGLPELSVSFLTTAPSDAGRAGGISPMLASTALILMVCLAVSLPIGLATAVLLAEVSRGSSLA